MGLTTNFQSVKVSLRKRKEGDIVSENRLLRGRIIQKFGTQGEFAEKLQSTEQTVTAKLNGRSQFSQNDIIKWCNLLDIESGEIGDYFFSDKLSKS